jgi:hypothetical protein
MSPTRLLFVLTLAVALSGVGLAHAQSLPSSASCMATCGTTLGDCASAAGQQNASCVSGCLGLHGASAAACAQACAGGLLTGISECKAIFGECATNCLAD